MGKKNQSFGPFTVKRGKDLDGEPGWLVFEDGEPVDKRELFDSEEDAVEGAETRWAEVLQEEITNSLPDDVDVLQAILKLINDEA